MSAGTAAYQGISKSTICPSRSCKGAAISSVFRATRAARSAHAGYSFISCVVVPPSTGFLLSFTAIARVAASFSRARNNTPATFLRHRQTASCWTKPSRSTLPVASPSICSASATQNDDHVCGTVIISFHKVQPQTLSAATSAAKSNGLVAGAKAVSIPRPPCTALATLAASAIKFSGENRLAPSTTRWHIALNVTCVTRGACVAVTTFLLAVEWILTATAAKGRSLARCLLLSNRPPSGGAPGAGAGARRKVRCASASISESPRPSKSKRLSASPSMTRRSDCSGSALSCRSAARYRSSARALSRVAQARRSVVARASARHVTPSPALRRLGEGGASRASRTFVDFAATSFTARCRDEIAFAVALLALVAFLPLAAGRRCAAAATMRLHASCRSNSSVTADS